tara:strand:- start:3302 stop:3601 length:300 start_codon:yes stop_codon:yes gene_type:complete
MPDSNQTNSKKQKVYIVYNGYGMEVFTTMKDAIMYATRGEQVYDNHWQESVLSQSSIRRKLKDWYQVSGCTVHLDDFTITPAMLHKRGSTYQQIMGLYE